MFRGSEFKLFAGMIERDPAVPVRAIPAPGGGSRAFCDRMNSWAQGEGQPGLGYIFFRDGEGAGPVARGLGPERTGRSATSLASRTAMRSSLSQARPAMSVRLPAQARHKHRRPNSV